MTIIDTLVTDRTQADETRVEQLAAKGWARMTTAEREEWLAGQKGAYNATDLNRVGEAIQYIAIRLMQHGYSASVCPKTDWKLADLPSPVEMQRYLDDVSTLTSALELRMATPMVPLDMDRLTVQEANDIERILLDVDRMLSNIAAAWFYAGEIYSGEI